MNFRKRWCTSTVVSDEGYAVTFRGRSQIVYQEGSLRVYIEAEMLFGRCDWAFSKEDMFLRGRKRLKDVALRQRIADRVAAVCEYLGLKLLIE